jgi:hypothetical protein
LIVDDVGEEPPKSDVEEDKDNADDDDEENEMDDDDGNTGNKNNRKSSNTRRNSKKGKNERDSSHDLDDDEENEFQDDDDADNRNRDDEDDDDDDDEEIDGKSSDTSGSPGGSNTASTGQLKRQRSNTPPLLGDNKALSTLDSKMQFTTNLLFLNGMDLGHVMSLLEQHCPSVLETYNNDSNNNNNNTNGGSTMTCSLRIPEYMEINVDLLMEEYSNVYHMIQQYCNDHMVKKRLIQHNATKSAIKMKDVSNRRKDRKT